ncbi:hypothetical protein [Emergencia sp. 1XD21-10]|uniref:hypothetical protein n=1 Tax=Emergencia sp. 1XD21-10 TaxID=2304569 RepID=UPI00192A6223|nr:hypothetical protein [Emergencia sp. 1XD21-10]
MNKNRLLSVMKLHGDTMGDVAKYLGIARSTLSSKVNEHGSEFSKSEIVKIKERYNLSADEVDLIFFTS